jgi:hypothetical protein
MDDDLEKNFRNEFDNLGKNILKTIRSAWDHPERKRIEDEIARGLSDVSNNIKKEAETIVDSQTGQALKTELKELGDRIKDKDTHKKVRSELISILNTANKELEKAIDKFSTDEDTKD